MVAQSRLQIIFNLRYVKGLNCSVMDLLTFEVTPFANDISLSVYLLLDSLFWDRQHSCNARKFCTVERLLRHSWHHIV